MPYAVPTPNDFRTRFPAFADADDSVITYWITDAQRIVTTDWIETDYQPAILSYAAHEMALAGLETSSSGASLPAGVTRFRSGSMDVSVSENVASATGYQATRYGQAFATFLRRNRGGVRVVGGGTVPEGTTVPGLYR